MAKSRGIPLSQVRPFFQVVVFVDPSRMPLTLKVETQDALAGRKGSDSLFEILRAEKKGALQFLHLKHTQHPSWVRGPSPFKDVEHDEAMLYRKDDYLFLSSNCRTLLDLLSNSLLHKVRHANAGDIEKVLAKRRPEIRSLGMQNLSSPGHSAPEGKIHFARDATYTLSPVRDAMYGLRHAFAVERGVGKGNSKPFGCSTAKRKVWGTWVDGPMAFAKECDRLAADLMGPDPGKRLWVLAAPLPARPAKIDPIAFYSDYTIQRKGIVWMEDGSGAFSSNWMCYLGASGTAHFEVIGNGTSRDSFELELDVSGPKVAVAYPAGTGPRKVKLCDDSGELQHRNAHDLVEVLNREESFTIVFTKGVSYRSGTYWKSSELDQPFNAGRTGISWAGIDLKRESLVSGRKDSVGDAILRFLKAEAWPQVVICDDGANEIADFIAVGKGRMALIHAKFSSANTPGLRVDDVQVVLAQSLKNLQFFHWAAVEPHMQRLESRVRPEFPCRGSVRNLLRDAYENQRTKRECWIVQPGISAAKLAAAPGNKIHSLLNHAESACLPGNVEFQFYCSA